MNFTGHDRASRLRSLRLRAEWEPKHSCNLVQFYSCNLLRTSNTTIVDNPDHPWQTLFGVVAAIPLGVSITRTLRYLFLPVKGPTESRRRNPVCCQGLCHKKLGRLAWWNFNPFCPCFAAEMNSFTYLLFYMESDIKPSLAFPNAFVCVCDKMPHHSAINWP